MAPLLHRAAITSVSYMSCGVLLLLLLQLFCSPLSGTIRMSRGQKKHLPTHLSWSSSKLYQLLPSTTIYSILPVHLRAWQSFYTISLQVLFRLPLGLQPSTSYSTHFFTYSMSSFRNICPYHHSLFCCSTKIILSIPSVSLNSLLGNLSSTLT